MNKVVIFVIILLSIIPWSTMIFLNNINPLTSKRSIILTEITHFWIVVFLAYLLFRRYFKSVDPFMYVFSLFCSDASYSLYTTFEVGGFVTNTTLPNATLIKPYLKSVHGAVLSYWNGTVHFILCIAIIALYTNRDSHREMSLYWAGSMLNSMIVILPACITGSDAINVTIFFNLIYLLLPLTVITYAIERRPLRIKFKFEPIWKRKVDFLFLLYLLAAICVSIFRGLTVLGGQATCLKDYLEVYEPYLRDKSNFPKFQALAYAYLFGVYYLAAAYGLINPGQHWMADWSLIHAGAAAQAQFNYIFGSIHHLTPKENQPPKAGFPAVMFWTINVTLFVVPHLFALWCQKHPEHYGNTYTVHLATPCRSNKVPESIHSSAVLVRQTSKY